VKTHRALRAAALVCPVAVTHDGSTRDLVHAAPRPNRLRHGQHSAGTRVNGPQRAAELVFLRSGRRDSNSRPSPWQRDANGPASPPGACGLLLSGESSAQSAPFSPVRCPWFNALQYDGAATAPTGLHPRCSRNATGGHWLRVMCGFRVGVGVGVGVGDVDGGDGSLVASSRTTGEPHLVVLDVVTQAGTRLLRRDVRWSCGRPASATTGTRSAAGSRLPRQAQRSGRRLHERAFVGPRFACEGWLR
jgi:hypothetical protein